ncbi:MAG: dTMP kinase [Candidatus Aenigmarchaeota archaeon]|nr:dTMP kinase [Candidatus Aenigmarchaeota archaeon]
MRGKLIVIEGLDGSGKDTQVYRLSQFLKSNGQRVEVLKYPDIEKPIGGVINRFLEKDHELSAETQFILFATDMLKDREKIISWLNEGATVLLSRYVTSTMAYQVAQGFPMEKGMGFVKLFDFLQPDNIIYIKISAATSVKRKINQKAELDRFESQEALQERVAQQYNKMIEDSVLGKWTVVDGEQSQEDVFRQVKVGLDI